MINLLLIILPRRIVYWMAIYYPHSLVRLKCWKKLGVIVGENTYFNLGIMMTGYFEKDKLLLEIGNRVALSPKITFICSSNPDASELANNKYVKNNLIKTKKITIKDDAWIGTGAIIMPGVTIGENSIVGAGSVVTRDVAPKTIVAGIPAKKIKDL